MEINTINYSSNKSRNLLVLSVLILLIIVGVSGYFVIKESQYRLIEHQAVNIAEIVARQASVARSVYSQEIVAKIKKDGTGVADIDYHNKVGAIPLPAQFLKEMSAKASTSSNDLYKYRPVSKWNINAAQNLDTPFLKSAWLELEQQDQNMPTKSIGWLPSFEIKNVGGKDVLHYLKADPASSDSCVQCHNAYEQEDRIIQRRIDQGIKPGRSWEKNQLLGAVFVEIPMDKIQSIAFKETTQTIVYIVGVLLVGLGVLAFFLIGNMSKAKEITKKLFWQARHDCLTNLPNRTSFEEKTDYLIRHAKKETATHAMCYLDLDQFKLVNDTCGHAAGDSLLCQVTKLLNEEIRSSDLLSRLGGDEFGVLLEDCPLERATAIAQNLCLKIKNSHFLCEGRTFDIGVSIGVVEINYKTESIDEVMSHADLACYSAKEAGRNRVQVYTEDDQELINRTGQMSWVPRITDALDAGRLMIYSQQIIPVDQEVSHKHYEILARLKDEDGNIIPPGQFLPAAERYDLMIKIDFEIISQTFHALITGFFEGLSDTGFVSINLSGQTLSDENTLVKIKKLMNSFQVNPRQICFEITESVAIANLTLVRKFITDMKLKGVRFALDDFGSGLSSLTYLKQLPVDYLKIDGSFIKDIVSDPIDRTLVDAINQMAHTMGLKTVAEYVESKEILDLLKDLGIDYAQGFHINKPTFVDHKIDLQKSA